MESPLLGVSAMISGSRWTVNTHAPTKITEFNMAALTVRRVLNLRLSRLRGLPRYVHTASLRFGAHDSEFNAAKERLNTLSEDPGNQAKLRIYALFKQATTGKCNIPKPGMMDFVGKAKWEAWNSLGDMSLDDAQKTYIDFVNELAGASAEDSQTGTTADTGSDDIKVEIRDKMQIITLNRPDKKNALKVEMYLKLTELLENGAADKNTTLTVLTGAGDYYCSGNDLSNFLNIDPSNLAARAEEGGRFLEQFVAAFINFPKPLISVVNGPAVGLSVTTMGLCDIVYSTDKATFNTPFSILGQSPEGCSSYTFPRIMGVAKASEMLLFNRKLTAAEACQCNLVTEVFPDHSFQNEVWTRLKAMAALPPNSLSLSKKLIREADSKVLHETNKREVELLVQRWQSDECMNAIMNFFSNKG